MPGGRSTKVLRGTDAKIGRQALALVRRMEKLPAVNRRVLRVGLGIIDGFPEGRKGRLLGLGQRINRLRKADRDRFAAVIALHEETLKPTSGQP